MKKNSFIEGAMVATIGVVISKIIGLIYVIPFVYMIGVTGGALYSYGYSIYAVFLSLSSPGIPVAMSKLISEYNELEYYHTKERAYKIGSIIMVIMSVILFAVTFIFAEQWAYFMIGDATGGNTIQDIAVVIRTVSTALLIVPFLGVTRGYLNGQKYMTPGSVSNVIEQIVRVFILLTGTYLAIYILKVPMRYAISIAIFGATIGALVAYLYLNKKIKQNKELLNQHSEMKEEEKSITNKELVFKVIKYAIPFILINFTMAATASVDTFTIVKALTSLNYDILSVETAFGVITNWGTKINAIPVSVVIGIVASLIPNLASGFVKRNNQDVSRKINQTIQLLLFLTLPMSIGLFLLAQPVWTFFYGYNQLSIDIYRLYTILPITVSFAIVLINAMQSINKTKTSLTFLLVWLLGKMFFNTPAMILLHNMGIPAYYGALLTSVISQVIIVIGMLIAFKKYVHISYKTSLKPIMKISLFSLVMTIAILLVSLVYPITATTRTFAAIQSIFYTVLGAVVYLTISYKTGLINDIFGKTLIDRVLIKLKLKKK